MVHAANLRTLHSAVSGLRSFPWELFAKRAAAERRDLVWACEVDVPFSVPHALCRLILSSDSLFNASVPDNRLEKLFHSFFAIFCFQSISDLPVIPPNFILAECCSGN